MLQSGRWGTPSCSPTPVLATKKPKAKPQHKPTSLSDEELRRRIFANANVLFPSSTSQDSPYEIVYGTKPRGEDSPWQYALLVRRNPSGDFTPLIRGQAWSTEVPWSMALQGLLDTTATAIHKKLGTAPMPPLGVSEELPRYTAPESPIISRTVTQ